MPRGLDGTRSTSSRSCTRRVSSSACSWTRSSRPDRSPEPALLLPRLGDAPRARHSERSPPRRAYRRRRSATTSAGSSSEATSARSRTPLTVARTTSSSHRRDGGSRTAAGPRCVAAFERVDATSRAPGGRAPRRYARAQRGGAPGAGGVRGEARRPAAQAESSTQVAGLDLALELLHGALRGLERSRERRRRRRDRAPARAAASRRRSRRAVAGVASCGGSPITSRSARAAASASSIPSGASRSRSSARLAMSPSRSPPPAVSAATSHSAAIDTAARSSARLVTTEPSS